MHWWFTDIAEYLLNRLRKKTEKIKDEKTIDFSGSLVANLFAFENRSLGCCQPGDRDAGAGAGDIGQANLVAEHN